MPAILWPPKNPGHCPERQPRLPLTGGTASAAPGDPMPLVPDRESPFSVPGQPLAAHRPFRAHMGHLPAGRRARRGPPFFPHGTCVLASTAGG